MITEAQLLADQAIVFDDFATETITIDGATYSCLVLENENGSTWGEGGEVLTTGMRVALKRQAVTSVPEEGDTVTYGGATYKVGSVDQSDSGASIIVEITRPNV